MSFESDQRVVELQFNNKQFEADVSTTISTLDKLQNKLQFDGASKGFADLEKAANKVNFDGLLASVNSIADRFTLKGTVIRKFFDDIANRALDLEHRLEKIFVSMTGVEQMGAAWDKYADKTAAVQTIMGAVANEVEDVGDRMQYVNRQLSSLNWFTDETSYKFLDMVNNIGKFTANQVPLEQAVSSMQGIATWASKAGANVTEAGRAMYNISQAISSGAMKLLDWKSIENANMATAEFKQTAIETAAAMGTLQRVGEDVWETMAGNTVTVKNFRETLKDGWLSSEVLLGTLNRYGDFTVALGKAYKQTGVLTSQMLKAIEAAKAGQEDLSEYMTGSNIKVSVEEFDEIIRDLARDEYDFGRSAFQAAQEAKTFQEAIDSVKEAVSTGWTTSFEWIFGDYMQAKELWTELAEYLYDIFNSTADARNEMLQVWSELGGRDDLIEGLRNMAYSFLDITETIKEAWHEVFGETTWYDLIQLTRKFREFTERIRASEEQLDRLRDILVKVFTPFRMIRDALAMIFKVSVTLIVVILKLAKNFITMFRSAGTLADGINLVADKYSLLGAAMQVVLAIFGLVLSVVSSAIDIFKNFGAALKNVTGITSFVDALKMIASVITGGIITAVNAFGTAIAKCANFMAQHVLTAQAFTTVLQFIASAFDMVSIAIIGVFEWCGMLFDRLGNVHSVTDFFKEIWRSIKDVYGKITDSEGFKKISDIIKSVFSEENRQKIENMTKALQSFWNSLSTGQVVALIFAGVIAFVMYQLGLLIRQLRFVAGALTGFGDVFSAIKGWFNAMRRATQYSALIQIGTGLLLIAGALVILSKIPSQNLFDAATALGNIIIAASLLTAAFGYLGTTVKNFSSIGLTLAAVGVGILAFAGALSVLSSVKIDSNAILGLTSAVLSFGGALYVLSKWDPKIRTSAASMIAFASGVYIMATSFAKLAEVSKDLNSKTVISAIGVVAAYAGALALMGKTRASAGAGALMSIATILLFVLALKQLASIQIPDIKSFSASVEAMIFGWLALCAGLKVVSGEMLKTAAALGLAITSMISVLHLVAWLAEKFPELGIKQVAGSVGAAILGLIGVLGGLIAVNKLMNSSGSVFGNNGEWKVLIAMAADAVAIAFAIKMLAGIKWNELLSASLALGGVIFALGRIAKYSQNLGDGKAIRAMAINIAAVAVSLMALSFFSKNGVSQIAEPAIAMSVALAGLAVAYYGVGKVASGIQWMPILMMAANVVAIGASMTSLLIFGKSAGQIIAAGASMALALGGLAGVALAAQALQKLNALQAFTGMIGVAGVAVALGFALKLMLEATPDSGSIILAGAALMFAALGLGGAAALANGFSKDWSGFTSLLGAALLAVSIGYALSSMAQYANTMWTAVGAFAASIAVLVAAVAVLGALSSVGIGEIGIAFLAALAAILIIVAQAFKTFSEHVSIFAVGVEAIALAISRISEITDEQIEQAKNNLIDFGKTLVMTIVGMYDDIEDASRTMGEYVVEGLRLGVESEQAKQMVTEVAYGLWARFKNAFESKRAADINSPSYAMYKDGQWIVYGLRNGIIEQQGVLEKTGENMWYWIHDGSKEAIGNVTEEEGLLYANNFSMKIIQNKDQIETAASEAISAAGSTDVLSDVKSTAKDIGNTFINTVGGTIESGKDWLSGKAKGVFGGLFGDTYSSLFGNAPVFISDEDKRLYQRWLATTGGDKQKAAEAIGYDPTDKSQVLRQALGLDPKEFDVSKQVENMTNTLGEYAKTTSGSAKATDGITESLEELLDVFTYASNSVQYFYDKGDKLLKMYDNTTPWKNAIKSTEDLILEHYKLMNLYDDEIQAIQNFGDMNKKQAKAAKDAWVEYFDSVSNGISQGFGSVFTAPSFVNTQLDAEITTFDTMMTNLDAQTRQMTYFTNTLIKLKREGLNDVYLQSLLDAGPENLSEIISWDQLTAEEIRRINAQYEALQNATTNLTMDYITATAEQFESMPQTVANTISKGIASMTTSEIRNEVYQKTAGILKTVLEADGDWEQFNGTRLGELLSEGIANGVEDTKDLAVSAVEQLAREMINELQKEVDDARAKQLRNMTSEWMGHITARNEDGTLVYVPTEAESSMISTLKDAVGYFNYASGSTNYDPEYAWRYQKWQSEGLDALQNAASVLGGLDNAVLSSNLAASNLAAQLRADSINADLVAREITGTSYKGTVSGSLGEGYQINLTQNNYSSDHLNAETIMDNTASLMAGLK